MDKLFFRNKGKSLYIVVIGCNRVGAALADSLFTHGYKVMIVDKSPGAFQYLPVSYAGNCYTGDITEIDTIEDIGIKSADKVFVVTSSDVTNMFIAEILVNKLGRDLRVISRLNDPKREEFYKIFQIETVCAETVFSNALVEGIAQMERSIEL